MQFEPKHYISESHSYILFRSQLPKNFWQKPRRCRSPKYGSV